MPLCWCRGSSTKIYASLATQTRTSWPSTVGQFMARRPQKAERARQYRAAYYGEILARVSANLRLLRTGAGLTQEAAAIRCGVTLRLFQRCEGRESNLTITTIARLCKGLEVDVVDLFRRID
jgi:hypothetical protein